MSASTAIGKVSESLRNLLRGEMAPPPDVTILPLDKITPISTPRINLFLYKVQENPMLKNMDWQIKQNEPDVLVPPPLSLNLFYLMTPYALPPNDPAGEAITLHQILGDAMRVFYENPIVPQEYLEGELLDAREQIKIMLSTLDLEELSKVWATFTKPFSLSVLYEVSVVQLDMLSEREAVMPKRVRQIGVPDVRVPFNPPVVEDMAPLSAPAGTDVDFAGRNLAGWRAYVTIMGRVILDGEEALSGDGFTVTIPGDLSVGFYEIRVDISHLHRSTFFFEVTS